MNNSYILPSYQGPIHDYKFGDWLKRNVGNIAQTIGGVALLASTPFTGPAGIAGASMLASGVGGIGGDAANTASSNAQAALDESAAKKNALIASKMAQYNTQQPMKFGGSMEETGTYAPNSLVPLNSPYRSILAKGGHLPEGKATLEDAKEFMKLYPEEMAMGIEVEKEHTGNMKLRQRISADHIIDHIKMTGGDPGYYTKLKQAGISDELNKMALGGMFDFKNGGIYVTPKNKSEFAMFTKKHGLTTRGAIGMLKSMKDGGLIDNKFKQLYGEGGVYDSIKPNGNILTEYKGGGTHAENPRGGIPVGDKARVEEGEFRFTDPDTGESYIFSNRIPYVKNK